MKHDNRADKQVPGSSKGGQGAGQHSSCVTACSSRAACLELRAAQPACFGQLRAKRHTEPEGKGMQGKLWGAKGREKLTHGSQMLSFGFLHPVLPLQQSHRLNLTELQPQEQQRLFPFIKPLGGLEPTLRVWYSGLNTNLNVASPLLFLSTIQLFFHDLLQAYFWGKGGCFLFLNNTAQLQFVRFICQIVLRQISCSNANCWNHLFEKQWLLCLTREILMLTLHIP